MPMTPCERRGYKVGDLFRVIEDRAIEKGSIVKLVFDDYSAAPGFEIIFGGHNVSSPILTPHIYEHIDNVEPLPKD